MSDLEHLLREFPGDSAVRVRRAWEALPEPARKAARKALDRLPGDTGRWRVLLGLARDQLDLALGRKRRVAIVGPASVGKSSLYNQLVPEKASRAEVSPVPGTTRRNQEGDVGVFAVVDTPGADAVGEVGEAERQEALSAARTADFLVVVFDALHGIKRAELELFRELTALGKPMVVALNKIDLVHSHRRRVVDHAASALGLAPEQVVECSAKDGENIERLLLAIAKAEPAIVAALGAALPAFRSKLAWAQTRKAAATAAAIALTPLPVVTVVPLLVVQSSLVLGIARIYDHKVTAGRAKELLATFGLGFLGRTLFQELSRLGGPPGWLLASAIASSTTVVMGYAASRWFETGERLTGDALRRLARIVSVHLVESLRGFGRRRPDRKSLEERVAGALEASPIADGRP